jgi:lysyl endopeptidase
MFLRLLPCLLLLAAAPLLAGGKSAPLPAEAQLAPQTPLRLELAPVDADALLAEDLRLAGKPGVPRRYGVVQRVDAVRQDAGHDQGGAWRELADGRWQWRLEVEATGATSLEFAFARLRLPAGAELWLRAGDGKQALGPLTEADNRGDGRYYSALLAGSRAVLELTLPAAKRPHLALQLEHVVYGYRHAFEDEPIAKSGSCNIDTICPQGDDYRDQIASVAHYTFASGGSSFSCSGTLLATGNRSLDLAEPRFATAHHCVSAASEVQSMVFYWGYESPTCRAPGSSASGSQLPRSANTRATQNGATLLATHPATDFTAVQLSAPVPAAARAFYSGWDRSGVAPPASVGIHHPAGHEKRITFNDDPLTTMQNCIVSGTASNTHWRIEQYEAGTTEQGSSGSGLWADQRDEAGDAEDELFIGVLSGGEASCSNPGEFDCYGRLSQAWDGGGSAATRMRDWFDRTGTNPASVPGMKICDPPSLSLDSPAFGAGAGAGTPVTFTATAAGGSAGTRSFSWDVDGDGVFDREGGASSIQVTYPRAQQVQVRVRVADSSGCDASVSRALDVLGPALVATPGTPQQVCGDNDAAIEPGERWKLPVTLRNSGAGALPAGGRALFARATQSFAPLATADLNDNGFGPRDDARTIDPIALGGGGLRLYGQTFAQAFMSTNGYVSFNPAETGADWSNGCNGGLDNGAVGPQLRPLHDDLVVAETASAGLRYGYFASCPRPAQSAPAAQGCHVFQWSHLQWIDSDTLGAPSGDATFQAIVYQPSGQIVYQYLAADTHAGGRATIGVIGGGGGDPLDAACNSANAAPAGRAYCLFDPAGPPAAGFPAGSFGPNSYGYRGFSNAAAASACPFTPVDLQASQSAAGLRLETPTLALPALDPGAQTALEVGFQLPESAACGSSFALDYVGAAAPGVSSFARGSVLGASVGVGGSCQASTACPAQIASIATRPGFYYNPRRSGNGLANFVYGNVYGGVWYTALADRSPTWYILNGDYADHLGVMPIRRFRNPAAPNGFTPQSEFVGTSWVAQVDPDSLVHAWQFDGGAAGVELLDATPLPFTNPNHSQTWYSTAESGWGLSIESLVTGPGTVLEFMVGYIYDAAGTARWVLGTGDSTSGGTRPLVTYRPHCPSCPWFTDWGTSEQAAGNLSIGYTGPASAILGSRITLPPPLSGSWNRDALPIITIGTPAPPGR